MTTCLTCGKEITNSRSYTSGECRFPLTHAHSTVENIKLPSRVTKILFRLNQDGKSYPADLSLQDKATLQNTRIHRNDFTTEIEALEWQK